MAASNRLQDHFVVLCQKLDVDRIGPILRQEKMLTSDEYEMLMNPMLSSRAKRERLLILLPRKGRDHFQKFGKCLVWSGQEELARQIGIDVARVPQAPFPVPEPDPQPSQAQLFQMFQSLIGTSQAGPFNSLPVVHGPSSQVGTGTSMAGPNSLPAQGVTTRGVGYIGNPHPVSQGVQPAPRRPVGRNPKVFILYCKDPTMGNDFCDNVLDLADLLNKSGRLDCIFDGYDNPEGENTTEIPDANWSVWTERQIMESDYVLLVCSPEMKRLIQNPSHSVVEMMKGKFFADIIANCIDPRKFISVFLNVPPNLEWLPTNLQTSSWYELKVHQLSTELEDTNGLSSDQFASRLGEHLQDPMFQGIASLLAYLRGDTYIPRPVPPSQPVQLPHTHMPPEPTSRQYATPTPHTYSHTSIPAPHSEFIAEGDLLKIAERLPRDWQHLGIKLGVEYSSLESLRTKYPFDTRSATMEMFGKWQQTKGRTATRKRLKECLVDLGYGRVAKEVFPND